MKRSAFILSGLTIMLTLIMACGGAASEPATPNTPASEIAADSTASEPAASTPSISELESKRARPHISTVGDELRFDRARLEETAIFSVRLTFTNASTVNQHNWLLVKLGTKDEVALAGLAAGPENSYIPPNDDRVLAHTGLLTPKEGEQVK